MTKTQSSMSGDSARSIVIRMVGNFPGFIDDTDVNGADLVNWLSQEIYFLVSQGRAGELIQAAADANDPSVSEKEGAE